MQPIVTDRVAWSVGLSVGLSVTLVSPAKTAAPIEIPFGLRTWVGPGNHVLDGGPDPSWEGAILRGRRGVPLSPDTLRTSGQKRLNRSRCSLGRRLGWAVGIMLDGGPEVPRDVAMATNFWTQFSIIGFVGYNFDCMIASNTLFDSRGGFFGVKLSHEDIADFAVLRDAAMATIFVFLYMGCTLAPPGEYD